MSDACTLIATAIPNPEHPDEMKNYLQKATELLSDLGGGAPNRMKVSDVIAGDGVALVMYMDFPSRKELVAAFESDGYQALIPGRDRGFKSMSIWIAGSM